MYINVLLNTSVSNLDRYFSYKVPEKMEKFIKVGKRVKVPFGKGNKEQVGIIIESLNSVNYDESKVKEIIEVIDDEFILSSFNIKLAKWISKRYLCNLSDSIRLMMPPGITKASNDIYNIKTEKWIHIKNREKVLEEYNNLKGLTSKRKEILDLLIDLDEIKQSELYSFFNINSTFLKWFVENEIIEITKEKIYRNPFENYNIIHDKPFELNKNQKDVYDSIVSDIDSNNFNEILLHGITGSGKTEVYMQLIDYVLKKGKNAIVLVPEISLTPQIVNRFLNRFGNIIAVLHSRLSVGERLDEFNRINRGEAKIVIGARSAIFAPLKNIGIVIVDEEHDSSYKSEMSPKYDAKEVAKKICEYNKSVLLLASATPSINSYYLAQKGEIKLLELNVRANPFATLPKINIIDMTINKKKEGFSNISERLFDEIKRNLEKGEQTILFLNKRGFNSSIVCQNCGWVYKCPNCDVSLTYHYDKRKLMCHYCGHEENIQKNCSSCGGSEFDSNVVGTQKIEYELNRAFPECRIIRMDYDTTNKKDGHLEIINKFKKENIDILVGTQMLAKGHDFPNVTLVGIINADMTLNMQDYRANEYAYSLFTQVAGRAGRSDKEGKVYIQVYNKDNFVLDCIKDNNYLKLYKSEIGYRKNLTYPPFCDIIQITLFGKKEIDVQRLSLVAFEDLKDFMKKFTEKKIMQIYPPVVSAVSKINNEYRWKILIKCKYNEMISNSLKDFLRLYQDNDKIRLSIDINSGKNI